MESCDGYGGSEVHWSGGGSAGWNGAFVERVWWAGDDGYDGSAALDVCLVVRLGSVGDL